jgi:carbonic anhydrase
MTFCTAVSCIDGRVHLPVIEYLQNRFDVDHVDLVTEPGAVAIVAGTESEEGLEAVYRRVEISVEAHQSVGIAVVAHHDCAGNPVAQEIQLSQLWSAVQNVGNRFPNVEVVALWVGDSWKPQEVGPNVRAEK